MSIDQTTVSRIARLARIKVADEDLPAMAGELTAILNWIEMLNEVDTDNVAPMTSAVEMEMKKRADVVTKGGIPEDIMTNAPASENGFFMVPKVVE